ncbi:hypothetical protein FH972_014421 [Carpinus fangiana]|uniref:RING-type domain-containing protein n=1 Tax=Carpinus fangiana TaxID=176857 RepID=A0A5N6RCE7_9ROSI|nr:hypothetical protein FH972_014421 [Carpinus fangiana]
MPNTCRGCSHKHISGGESKSPLLNWACKEAVKEVKLEEAWERAICLEDLLVGFEAAKLPCSHGYHRGCIAKWLDTRNKCPLCRSQVV